LSSTPTAFNFKDGANGSQPCVVIIEIEILMPDHFLAVRVPGQTVVPAVQSQLLSRAPQLRSTFVDPVSTHVTLGMLQLGTDTVAIDAAKKALAMGKDSICQRIDTPLGISFDRLDTFRKTVLYLKPDETSESIFQMLHECLKPHFEELTTSQGDAVAPIWIASHDAFRPHLTIAKHSRVYKRWKVNQKPPVLYEPELYEGIEVLLQSTVDSIQLCSMRGRQQGKYYNIVAEYSLCGPQCSTIS
jgi:2'-5' RNA ligase